MYLVAMIGSYGGNAAAEQEVDSAPGDSLLMMDFSMLDMNLTVLRMVVNHLPPYELSLLLNQFNASSVDELLNHTSKRQEKPYEEKLMEYQEYRLTRLILLYIPPALLILGILGNILSFIILMRRSMRKFSTYVYLAVLSIIDTLILLIGLLPLWIGELTGLVMRDQSDWICKLTNVIGYTASDYSVWLIIAVTFERYIAVCHPLKAPSMCNRRRALIVIISVLIALLLINLHFVWTVEIHTYSNGIYQCESTQNFTKLVQDIWPWVDAFLYSFLPFVVISVVNFLIIRQVVQARHDRKRLQSNISDQRKNRVQETSMKLTFMLLTISFAFLLTTLPMNISLIGTAFYNRYANDISFTARYKLVRTVTEMLMYLNHSMNFYLYCATGQKFRQQLLLLFCHKRTCVNKMLVKGKCNVSSAKTKGSFVANNGFMQDRLIKVNYEEYSPQRRNPPTKIKEGGEYIPMKVSKS